MASTTLKVNYLDEGATMFDIFSYTISGSTNNISSYTSRFNFVQLFYRMSFIRIYRYSSTVFFTIEPTQNSILAPKTQHNFYKAPVSPQIY